MTNFDVRRWLSGRSSTLIATDADQCAWKAARTAHREAGGITGTDAGILMAGAFGKTVHDLYAVAKGLAVEEDIGSVPRVRWGNLLEPVIVAEAARETGEEIHRSHAFVRSTVHPNIGATLDGYGWRREDGRRFVAEVKSSGAPGWDDGIPEHVEWQVQAQMIAADVDLCLVAVLRFAPGGIDDLFLGWVEADPEAQAELLASADAFRHLVRTGELPEVDGSDGCARLLSARYRRPSKPDPVVLGGEFIELDEERETIAGALKNATARKREIENQIKAAIGEHTKAVLPNGTTYSWSPASRANADGSVTEYRTLRRSSK